MSRETLDAMVGAMTEKKAKSIAFEHAGVTEQDIRQLEIELDYDDRCV